MFSFLCVCVDSVMIVDLDCTRNKLAYSKARQTRPNSRGVAEGHPRSDKGGGCNISFTFYVLKIELFRVFTLSD